MPVSKSAKKALSVAIRRHEENLIQRDTFKKAVKAVKKAATTGAKDLVSLFNQAQSSLDTAAKKHTIHRNKAARLKSRLAKQLSVAPTETAPKKAAVKKAPAKKATTAKKKNPA